MFALNKFVNSAIAVSAVSGMLTLGAVAQNSSNGQMSSADKQFVTKAAQGGMAEVELGQLAQQKAQSDDVKKFGERMVNDHTKANDQLKQIASQENITLPTSLDRKDEAEKARLSKLSGAQFDRAYMNLMLRDHRTDISEFQKEANSGKDQAVKSFASQTLPILQDHLKNAQSIAPNVRAEAGGNAKSSTMSSNQAPQK